MHNGIVFQASQSAIDWNRTKTVSSLITCLSYETFLPLFDST